MYLVTLLNITQLNKIHSLKGHYVTMGDGGGGHWLVQMEWRPARCLVCLPLLIFPCTIKSRSSLLAPAHPGGPRKRAVKWLWCGYMPLCITITYTNNRKHLSVPRSQQALTLYPATDCTAATDISGVSGCWQLSR